MLFQDRQGGFELADSRTREILQAEPEDGAFILNIGNTSPR